MAENADYGQTLITHAIVIPLAQRFVVMVVDNPSIE
jgi:hypothetical protein